MNSLFEVGRDAGCPKRRSPVKCACGTEAVETLEVDFRLLGDRSLGLQAASAGEFTGRRPTDREVEPTLVGVGPSSVDLALRVVEMESTARAPRRTRRDEMPRPAALTSATVAA